jgi:hypothetical protein
MLEKLILIKISYSCWSVPCWSVLQGEVELQAEAELQVEVEAQKQNEPDGLEQTDRLLIGPHVLNVTGEFTGIDQAEMNSLHFVWRELPLVPSSRSSSFAVERVSPVSIKPD